MTERFIEAYKGTPPWETDRPQPVFVDLAERGEITGAVLDVGSGTGENAMYLVSRGIDVYAFDVVEAAVDRARAKAHERNVPIEFHHGDAMKLSELGRRFDTAIDSGVFHVFSDPDRARYVTGLACVLRPQGVYHMICFSEHEPGDWGPRRVTQDEIRSAFADGWTVESIEPARFELNLEGGSASAWLSRIVKT